MKLLEENNLLNQQISNYQLKVNYLEQTDSLRLAQIENYQAMDATYLAKIDTLNQTIKKKNRTITCWAIGGVTISVGLILLLFLK